MNRLIRFILVTVCCAWLSQAAPIQAQNASGRLSIPSSMIASDGTYIAWAVPSAGGSLIYARVLQGEVQARSIGSTSTEVTTLLLSDGIVVWGTRETQNGFLKQSLNGYNLLNDTPIPVAMLAYQPLLVGSTLFWWDTHPDNPDRQFDGSTGTIMRQSLAPLGAVEAVYQTHFGILFPGQLRAAGGWIAWSEYSGFAYGSVIWNLFALPPNGTVQLIKENIGCADSRGYDRFALTETSLIYSSSDCYRGPSNDGKLRILNFATGQEHVSGPQGNATLFAAGRFVLWNSYGNNNDPSRLWGFDPSTNSAFQIGTGVTPRAYHNGLLVWSSTTDGTTAVSYAPLTSLLPNAPRTADDPTLIGRNYYPETGHTLGGSFRTFWNRNGGLAVFGFPLTEEFIQQSPDATNGYAVQYLERQRYEYHPEHAGTAYEVLLGRLGAEALARSGRIWQDFPKADPSTPHYYAQTGQAIAPQFWEYWRSHGLEFGDRGVSEREALALWGLPISPPQQEQTETGEVVLTQWFERARFEYHPGNPAPYQVLLGRLAVDQVESFGWK